MDRPPWELYLIEGLDAVEGVPPGGFAVLLKIHHAAVDGVAGTEILNALHDRSPDAAQAPMADDTWRPDARPSDLHLVAKAAAHVVVDPVGTARRLLWPTLRTVPGMAIRTLRSAEARSQTVAPVAATRFNRQVGAHRVWDARRFPFSEVKEIRREVPGVSVNDVVMAMIGGSLRIYLQNKNELPETPLVALMPISLRPTATQAQAAGPAAPEVAAARGGNRFAMANVPLGTHIEDPIERIAAIAASTETAKEYALDAPSLVEWSEALPGAIAGTAQRAVIRLANRAGRTMGVHMIVTNVPGPQNPLYFSGARCLFTSGMAPVVDGMGIIHAVTSYQEQFVACFTADRDMTPDPAFYASRLDAAFGDLKKSAGITRCGGARAISGGPGRRRARGYDHRLRLPAARPVRLRVGGLVAGVVGVSELPSQFLAAQLVGAGVAVGRGAARTPKAARGWRSRRCRPPGCSGCGGARTLRHRSWNRPWSRDSAPTTGHASSGPAGRRTMLRWPS